MGGARRAGRGVCVDPPRGKMNVSGGADVHKRHHRGGAEALAEVAGFLVAMFV